MQSLQTTLDNQITNLNKLAGLLDKELHLISSRNAEALMNLLKEKEQVLESIQDTDEFLNKHYHTAMTEDRTEETQALIDESRRLLELCQYQTQINQKAVEQGQLRLTHLRNLMLEVRAKESLTYDKSGKPNATRSGSGVSA